MKKIDREFCLTDNSVNCYGYRLLTEGLMLEKFNPPIGYLMHERDNGVAVRWEDFRIEGDKLFAKPVINDQLFPNLAQQIEEDFYCAASVGHIVALEWTDKMMIEGQSDYTITKWYMKEVSIVDIPGNENAVASKLYDEDGNVVHDLCDKTNSLINNNNNKQQEMKKLLLEVFAPLAIKDLTAESADDAFLNIVQTLVAKSQELDKVQKELIDLKAKVVTDEVESILAQAEAEHRISAKLSAELKKNYSTNPAALRELVACFEPKLSANEVVGTQSTSGLENLTFDEIDKAGRLKELKDNYPDLYTKKYEERFKVKK